MQTITVAMNRMLSSIIQIKLSYVCMIHTKLVVVSLEYYEPIIFSFIFIIYTWLRNPDHEYKTQKQGGKSDIFYTPKNVGVSLEQEYAPPSAPFQKDM